MRMKCTLADERPSDTVPETGHEPRNGHFSPNDFAFFILPDASYLDRLASLATSIDSRDSRTELTDEPGAAPLDPPRALALLAKTAAENPLLEQVSSSVEQVSSTSSILQEEEGGGVAVVEDGEHQSAESAGERFPGETVPGSGAGSPAEVGAALPTRPDSITEEVDQQNGSEVPPPSLSAEDLHEEAASSSAESALDEDSPSLDMLARGAEIALEAELSQALPPRTKKSSRSPSKRNAPAANEKDPCENRNEHLKTSSRTSTHSPADQEHPAQASSGPSSSEQTSLPSEGRVGAPGGSECGESARYE